MKHFENLWEEAEQLTPEDPNELDFLEKIKDKYQDSSELSEEELGLILLQLTFLSKKYNLNAYSALQSAIHDWKFEQEEIAWLNAPLTEAESTLIEKAENWENFETWEEF